MCIHALSPDEQDWRSFAESLLQPQICMPCVQHARQPTSRAALRPHDLPGGHADLTWIYIRLRLHLGGRRGLPWALSYPTSFAMDAGLPEYEYTSIARAVSIWNGQRTSRTGPGAAEANGLWIVEALSTNTTQERSLPSHKSPRSCAQSDSNLSGIPKFLVFAMTTARIAVGYSYLSFNTAPAHPTELHLQLAAPEERRSEYSMGAVAAAGRQFHRNFQCAISRRSQVQETVGAPGVCPSGMDSHNYAYCLR